MYSRRAPNSGMRMSIAAGLLAGLFLVAAMPGGRVFAGDVEKQINKEFDVDFGGTLFLDSDLGSIKVRSHSSKQVKVVVFLKADTFNERKAEAWFDEFYLSFEQKGRDVEIVGEREGGFFGSWRQKISVHFDISVPAEYNLNLKTAGGSVDVEDIGGDAELRTSGGGIRMGQINGDVIAATSGGSVSLQGANGAANVKTSGGRITLGEIHGDVNAHTSGGGIEVDGVDGDLEARSSGGGLDLRRVNGNLQASTSGGSITAELLKQIDRDLELRTSGGGIRLDVPDDLRATINASTSGGSVTTNLPVTVQGKIDKSELHGKLSGGGPELFLRSSGGSIVIR